MSVQMLQTLTELLSECEQDLNAAEAEVKNLKDRIKSLKEDEIPATMAEMGLVEVGMRNGTRCRLSQVVYASISKDKEDEALNWLESHDLGGIVKRELVVDGANAEEVANVGRLVGEGRMTTRSKVHPMTLRSCVRELLDKGQEVPEDLFNIHVFDEAKVSLIKGVDNGNG